MHIKLYMSFEIFEGEASYLKRWLEHYKLIQVLEVHQERRPREKVKELLVLTIHNLDPRRVFYTCKVAKSPCNGSSPPHYSTHSPYTKEGHCLTKLEYSRCQGIYPTIG